MVIAHELKGWEDHISAAGAFPKQREIFTLEGFYEQLVRWISVDDQVS